MTEAHASKKATYLKVFFILFVLTVIEVAIPTLVKTNPDIHVYMGLSWDRAALLLLAVAKASFVGLYFMHLKWETAWLRFIALTPAVMVFFAFWLIAEAIYR